MMKIKGTTVYPAAVQRVLDGIDPIVEYVMIVTSPSPLSDEVEIVAAVNGDQPAVVRTIQEQLQAELKVKPSVRVASLSEVEQLQFSKNLRKKQVFIDRR